MYKLDLINIGRNIKVERVRKGYSQEQLAEFTDTTRHSISLIECGLQHPKLLTTLKIANALSLDINEILK